MKNAAMPENRRVWLCVVFAMGLAGVQGQFDRNERWCGDDSCYDLLNLDSSATHSEIKSNYKKLSLELHPDRNDSEEAKVQFPKVAIAYEILSDPERRKKYDKYVNMKKQMDSPRENVIVVAAVLFVLLSVCTKFYQAQRLQRIKGKILENGGVVRLLNEKYKANLPLKTGATAGVDRKTARKQARKQKKNASKSGDETPASEKVTNAQIDAALRELDIYVAGWNGGSEPNFVSAAVSVATFPLTGVTSTLSTLRWIWQYYIMKQDLSLDDAYTSCRKTNDFDQKGWDRLSAEERASFLNKEGEWSKAWKAEKRRKREAEEAEKRRAREAAAK